MPAPNLTDEERDAVAAALRRLIDEDRFPFSKPGNFEAAMLTARYLPPTQSNHSGGAEKATCHADLSSR